MDDFLPGLDYAEALWESGLKIKRVCKTIIDDEGILKTPKIIKTFGSFIDPLEKEGYSEKPPYTNWPNIGDTIVIDAKCNGSNGFWTFNINSKTNIKRESG